MGLTPNARKRQGNRNHHLSRAYPSSEIATQYELELSLNVSVHKVLWGMSFHSERRRFNRSSRNSRTGVLIARVPMHLISSQARYCKTSLRMFLQPWPISGGVQLHERICTSMVLRVRVPLWHSRSLAPPIPRLLIVRPCLVETSQVMNSTSRVF